MTKSIKTGLDRLLNDVELQKKCKGNLGYLGHSPAVTENLELGLEAVIKTFGKRVAKAFGPQHGFVTDVQDNMIETDHFDHPYFKIPVYSLYGKARVPTAEMLADIDTLIIDLQDVGTRVYTYITTLGLAMEKCQELGIKVVVLDRPNPVGGTIVEGPVLSPEWRSFVGHHPIPQRHGLTLGEVARLQKSLYSPNCDLEVIAMENWQRADHWGELKRTWINPSPNLPTPASSLTFCGTVLYEGTNISEGRGTTRSLEVLGAPGIDPFAFRDFVSNQLKETDLDLGSFELRPVTFHPMFQKHADKTCGGLHIHPLTKEFKSWTLGAFLLKCFHEWQEFSFQWNNEPYEYETRSYAINFINGNEDLKSWVDSRGHYKELSQLAVTGHKEFINRREDILLYS